MLKDIAAVEPRYGEPHYYLGRIYWKEGDHQRALDSMRTAHSLEPYEFETVQSIRMLLQPRGDWQQILLHWDRFLAGVTDNGEAYYERSFAYSKLGDRLRQREDLERAWGLGYAAACRER